jgi:methyl-accepting chemotaxis protein
MRWTIRKKLYWAFGLIAALLILSVVASHLAQVRSSKTEEALTRTGKLIADLQLVRYDVVAITGAQRAYLITANESDIAAIPQLRAEYKPALDRVAAAIQGDSAQQTRLDSAMATIAERRKFVDRLNQLFKEQGPEAARKFFGSGEDNRLAAQIDGYFAEMKDAASQQLHEEEDADVQLQHWVVRMQIATILISLLLTFSVARWLANSISRNVEISVNQLTAISEKDLSQADAAPASNDELAEAIVAINRTRESMAHALADVARAASQVAAAGTQIEATSREISSATTTEKQSVDHFASSLTEMNAATMNVAEHAELASSAANEAVTTAVTGRDVVHRTAETMNRINEKVREASSDITALGAVTGSIGEVVKMIQDIAEQTNLLALNAAIEAARAGEQGKGFAVVAQEVRQLAERTSKFTGEIAAKIDSVQQGSERAVNSMRSGEQVVAEGVEQFHQVAEALDSITERIESAQRGIAMIATATTEQSAETSGLTENINAISSEVTVIAGKVEESAQACAELAQLAASMQQVVDSFRLPEERRR